MSGAAAPRVVMKNPIVEMDPPVAMHVTAEGFIEALGERLAHTVGVGLALL